MQIEIRRMNNEFHQTQKYQKINEYQFINSMFFGTKKKETTKVDDTSSKDLELVTKMNQDTLVGLAIIFITMLNMFAWVIYFYYEIFDPLKEIKELIT